MPVPFKMALTVRFSEVEKVSRAVRGPGFLGTKPTKLEQEAPAAKPKAKEVKEAKDAGKSKEPAKKKADATTTNAGVTSRAV